MWWKRKGGENGSISSRQMKNISSLFSCSQSARPKRRPVLSAALWDCVDWTWSSLVHLKSDLVQISIMYLRCGSGGLGSLLLFHLRRPDLVVSANTTLTPTSVPEHTVAVGNHVDTWDETGFYFHLWETSSESDGRVGENSEEMSPQVFTDRQRGWKGKWRWKVKKMKTRCGAPLCGGWIICIQGPQKRVLTSAGKYEEQWQ